MNRLSFTWKRSVAWKKKLQMRIRIKELEHEKANTKKTSNSVLFRDNEFCLYAIEICRARN